MIPYISYVRKRFHHIALVEPLSNSFFSLCNNTLLKTFQCHKSSIFFSKFISKKVFGTIKDVFGQSETLETMEQPFYLLVKIANKKVEAQ